MERNWKDIFRITEEEEGNFDAAHSEHINSYINIFYDRLKPYNTCNLSRLNNENFHTRKIEKYEIIRYLRKSKKRAPGDSKINKVILEKCTDNAIQQLVNIFNACFSGGYFSTYFKKAIIKFIPKDNKSTLKSPKL